jgi:hypothetical protein
VTVAKDRTCRSSTDTREFSALTKEFGRDDKLLAQIAAPFSKDAESGKRGSRHTGCHVREFAERGSFRAKSFPAPSGHCRRHDSGHHRKTCRRCQRASYREGQPNDRNENECSRDFRPLLRSRWHIHRAGGKIWMDRFCRRGTGIVAGRQKASRCAPPYERIGKVRIFRGFAVRDGIQG